MDLLLVLYRKLEKSSSSEYVNLRSHTCNKDLIFVSLVIGMPLHSDCVDINGGRCV